MNTSIRNCDARFFLVLGLNLVLVCLIFGATSRARANDEPVPASKSTGESESNVSETSFYERIAKVTLEEEKQLGQRLLPLFLERYNLTPDRLIRRGQRSEYVRDVSSGLPQLLKHRERYRKLDIAYVDTKQRILFGLPGGMLIASRERVYGTRTEDALFGLIAHEVSLLDRGCFLELLFDSAGQRRAVDSISTEEMRLWVAKQFPQEIEMLANKDVHGWMLKCVYDPNRYADYLDKVGRLIRTANDTRGIDLEMWRVNHAAPEERAEQLRRLSGK